MTIPAVRSNYVGGVIRKQVDYYLVDPLAEGATPELLQLLLQLAIRELLPAVWRAVNKEIFVAQVHKPVYETRHIGFAQLHPKFGCKESRLTILGNEHLG